ncbi:hypothetical protein KKE34_03585 [Patescibacteria group bacterium]|nr:hypothetical protein [Patescibacteria group bacterium]MBU1885664.1 hypothetical protein [Patescibacteria group bacterium]
MKQIIFLSLLAILFLSGCSLSPKPNNESNPLKNGIVNNLNKTYSSKKYGLEVTYPNDWSIDSETPGWIVVKPNAQIDPNSNPDDGTIVITTFQKSQKTVEQYMSELNSSTGTKNNDVYKFIGKVNVGDKNIEGILTQGGCCGLFGKHIFVSENGRIFQITLRGTAESSEFQNESVFNEIVKNIRFVE